MTNELIAKIKAEIDRRYEENREKARYDDYYRGMNDGLDHFEQFLDTLESEKPMNPEAAMKELDEKIALVKQSGTWDGVDVDKYMDEVRGREPEKPMELEEEVRRYYFDVATYISRDNPPLSILAEIARHFAEWGYLRAAEKYNEIEYNRQRAEEDTPKDRKEAADEHVNNIAYCGDDIELEKEQSKRDFIAGAEWQYQKDRGKFAQIIAKTWCEGFDAYKEQMISALKNGGELPIEFYDKLHEVDQAAFQNGKKAMKEQMMKEAVKWLVDDDYDELTDKGRFILGSVGIGYNGYYISYSDLLKLPKEDKQ